MTGSGSCGKTLPGEPGWTPAGTLSLSRWAVRHVLAMAREGLDEAVRQKAALCILDCLRGRLGAQHLPWADTFTRSLGRLPTAPQASCWGLPTQIAATDAAFGNGVLSHALIHDDMHVPSGAHIGVVVLPAMLALAERESLSGRALLTGVAAGYEMMARAGMAIRSGAANRHFRPSGLSGAYGAAAGAVAALRMDEDVAVNALGFAGNLACGLNEWPWSGGQEIFIHAGTAARNALVAIDLAQAGLTASEMVLEGKDGMFAAYGSGPQAAQVFCNEADRRSSILHVKYKPYPGCNFIQTPVAAALQVRAEHAIDPGAMDSITIRTFDAARRYPGCDFSGPFRSVVQAKMSIQYGVAAALLYGRADEAAFASFADPDLVRLLTRCHIEVCGALNACYPGRQPAEVEIRCHDGRVVSCTLDDVPWLDRPAVEARFDRQARTAFGAGDAQRIKQAVFSLWETDDCQPFFQKLAAARFGTRRDEFIEDSRSV